MFVLVPNEQNYRFSRELRFRKKKRVDFPSFNYMLSTNISRIPRKTSHGARNAACTCCFKRMEDYQVRLVIPGMEVNSKLRIYGDVDDITSYLCSNDYDPLDTFSCWFTACWLKDGRKLMLLVEQVMPTQFVSSRRARTVASWLVYTGSSGKCLAAYIQTIFISDCIDLFYIYSTFVDVTAWVWGEVRIYIEIPLPPLAAGFW